jgi:hypothetical protein
VPAALADEQPPFGESHWPVKYDPSPDARKSAVVAISRGSPIRWSGVRASVMRFMRGDIGSVIGVSM